jgi:hypothetical protein
VLVTRARLACGALAAAGWLAASVAQAGPTKAQCIAASEDGQDLEHAGKLREARSKLAMCVAASCPGVLREDCAQKLGDVGKRIPTVVFAAKNAAGDDLTDVRVTVDGAPLVEQLDGTAVELDPGEHRFTFEAEGLPRTTKSFVLREGEKGRHELIVLKAHAGPGAASATAAPSSTSTDAPHRSSDDASTAPGDSGAPSASSGDGQRTVGWILGGAGVVGIGIGSAFGLMAKSTYNHAIGECPGSNPKSCDSAPGVQDGATAHSQATISTVAFVAGGVALAAGFVVYLTAPKSGVSVGANLGPGTALLRMEASW